MEGDGEDPQVSVESSWTVLKGSLESCVSVVFLDPDTYEPMISSSPHSSTKLVLVPPAEPVPCEITVKFQGRLCHVQSLYTSSTARICEIYSRSRLETDCEYVCTVKGWIPCKADFFSDDGTEINLKEDSVTKRGDEVLVKSSGSDSSIDGVHEGVMSSSVSSTTHIMDDECQKSVCSSGEDSWVNVKMSRSFSAEGASVNLMAPDLDNWHVPLNAEELVQLEDQLGMASRGLEGKEQGLENAVKSEGSASIRQDMFEAEVELLDHDPWAAITIRLLSLQDKSVVEVDQMVFLAISGPVAEPASSACHSDGKEPTSALFAMFLPSILQMARGVSGKNEISSRPCEEKQEIMDVAHAGKEEVCKEFCPSSVVSVAECASSEIGLSPKLEEADQSSVRELDMDGNISNRTEELGNEVLQPGLNHNPVCTCKGAGDAIAKEVTTTFEEFSERFDRLESLCLRMESFLHKAFESLDERITRLEVQNIKGSGETGSMSKHLGTLAEVQMSHQVHPNASEPKAEVLCVSTESAVQDDFEMQHQSNNPDHTNALPPEPKEEASLMSTESHVKEQYEVQLAVKEAPLVNTTFSRSADIENDVPLVIQELPSEPDVMVINMDSKDKEPHVSLDDAWDSALSAFASSLPSLVADNKNSVASLADELLASLADEQLLGSTHTDGSASTSHCSKEPKEEGIGTSPSFTPEFQPVTLDSKDMRRTNEVRSAPEQELAAAGVESIDCIDDTEGRDSSLLNCFGAHETDATINLLDLIEVQSSSHDVDVAPSQALSQQDAQPSSPQFDVFSSAHSNTMLFGETLDDWAALGGLKTRSLPLFKSSSVENQDAALKSKLSPHNRCNPISDSQGKANFDLFGWDLEYDFFQQRSLFSSLYAESRTAYAEKSEEESLCNASLELDFLSGHILSEQGEAVSITEVQANGFPDLLEDSQDGRTCSEDSMCFSQDFDAGPNDLSDKRWPCSPNIFYMHDPELTDDETDNTAGGEDERTDTSDSILQGDLSDTDSTQDLPFWPGLQHNARNNEQPAAVTVFPGFENLC